MFLKNLLSLSLVSTNLKCLVIKRRRWKWLGHVLRMDNTRHAKIAISWKQDGKRKRDCPKETWRRTIQRERQDLGSSHGLTQPEWPKKEINGEDLLKARYSSGRDGNRRMCALMPRSCNWVKRICNFNSRTFYLHIPFHLRRDLWYNIFGLIWT